MNDKNFAKQCIDLYPCFTIRTTKASVSYTIIFSLHLLNNSDERQLLNNT